MKTGISLSSYGYSTTVEETIRAIRGAGFDSFFTGFYGIEETEMISAAAAACGLEYESIHAPFGGMNAVWDEGEEGDDFVRTLKAVADRCQQFGIRYFTMHCMNVPEFNPADPGLLKWSQLGLDRMTEVVDYAASRGVKACLENVEFPQYELRMLMEQLRIRCPEGLGFTWDVGHEHCYTAPFDVVEAFGDLMVGTHVHDNYGQKDSTVITWNDDSHILPFEGNIDYEKVAARLRACRYHGSITLEVGKKPQDALPRTQVSEGCTLEQYLAIAHERAMRIVCLCNKTGCQILERKETN